MSDPETVEQTNSRLKVQAHIELMNEKAAEYNKVLKDLISSIAYHKNKLHLQEKAYQEITLENFGNFYKQPDGILRKMG